VTPEVIDGPKSIVIEQAENRLHLQKALMAELVLANVEARRATAPAAPHVNGSSRRTENVFMER